MRFAYFTARRFLTAMLIVVAGTIGILGYTSVSNATGAAAITNVVRHPAPVAELPTEPPDPSPHPYAGVVAAQRLTVVLEVQAAEHRFHLEHEAHERHLAALSAAKKAAALSIASDIVPAKAPAYHSSTPTPVTVSASGCSDPSGHLSYAQVGMLWLCAGGPAWAEQAAENVSECESGHWTNGPHAYNPSGASGLWQILGQVVPGWIFDAHVNALNAVAKFKASGETWAQWVCKP